MTDTKEKWTPGDLETDLERELYEALLLATQRLDGCDVHRPSERSWRAMWNGETILAALAKARGEAS